MKVNSQSAAERSALELIKFALSSGADLGALLDEHNLSYEDLRYENAPPLQLLNTEYVGLSGYAQPFHGVPVVSFFAGCGGIDLGFETAGFEHLALVEHNEVFCDTLRLNRDWEVLGPPHFSGDVSDTTGLIGTLADSGVKTGFEGVFVGGPPCQPFSIAANQRFSKSGENFKRVGFDHEYNGNLLFDYISVILEFKPAVFLIENVPGLIDVDGGRQVEKAYELLKASGYQLEVPMKMNAAHYGVPQQRERVFIIGSRTGRGFRPPQRSSEIIPCISALNGIPADAENHVTRKHKASSIARYVQLEVGKRDKLGRVDRLDPSLPSKTVIAGGSAGGGRSHLHPFIPRTLSVRECARLQTFPDNYVFSGSSARQFTQVGNAVPPVLAAQLGQSIYDSFF